VFLIQKRSCLFIQQTATKVIFLGGEVAIFPHKQLKNYGCSKVQLRRKCFQNKEFVAPIFVFF